MAALGTADGRQVWQHRSLTDSGRADVDRSGGTRCVAGRRLAAHGLAHGKELRSTGPLVRPSGAPPAGTPTVVGGWTVYATEVVFPARLGLRTGRRTEWIETVRPAAECHPGQAGGIPRSAMPLS
ncbi:hypothetical protein ACPCSD_24320 [Streptomyces griseoincarnatus]|uniref:Uncharacterized protein n=1 Tax=Streptomyces tunisiensis TaxID=948699 RepID=A0ABP7XLB4_9ACTN